MTLGQGQQSFEQQSSELQSFEQQSSGWTGDWSGHWTGDLSRFGQTSDDEIDDYPL